LKTEGEKKGLLVTLSSSRGEGRGQLFYLFYSAGEKGREERYARSRRICEKGEKIEPVHRHSEGKKNSAARFYSSPLRKEREEGRRVFGGKGEKKERRSTSEKA